MVRVTLVALLITLVVSCSRGDRSAVVIQESTRYEASLFRQNCAICHGPEAQGRTLDDGRQVPNLRAGEHKYTTAGKIRQHITDGGNGMVPFRDQLTQREIDMLVDFVMNDLRQGNGGNQ
jgi:mono/diheme cytochrome c family protein